MQLTDPRELFRSIALSPIPAIVTGPLSADNPILAFNRPFEALTGFSEPELVGRNCRILAGPDTEPDRSAAIRAAIESATPAVVELTNYRKDGSKFRNAVMIAPVLGDDGEAAYFVGSQMEINPKQTPDVRASARERLVGLTPRQSSVLRLMARGLRNRQIAQELGLTEKTVKMHRGALVRRLGLESSTQALRLAIEAGF